MVQQQQCSIANEGILQQPMRRVQTLQLMKQIFIIVFFSTANEATLHQSMRLDQTSLTTIHNIYLSRPSSYIQLS